MKPIAKPALFPFQPHLHVPPLCLGQRLLLLNGGLVVGIIILPTPIVG
jgi:hypothetical protein